MKQLSHEQIVNCENAREHRCRCRCQGRLHGARRVSAESGLAGFYNLPADDPHHLQSPAERKAEARTRRQQMRAAFNKQMREEIWQRIAERCQARELAGFSH